MAGIPSSSVAGGGGSFALITDTLAGGAVASFNFAAIVGSYLHLRLIFQARSDQGAAQVVSLRLNGDSGANYYSESISGAAGVAGASEFLGATSGRIGVVPSTAAAAGNAGLIVIDIANYAATVFNKNWVALGGRQESTATSNTIEENYFGRWGSTAAVTQVTILPAAGNFIAGSRCTLYGIA